MSTMTDAEFEARSAKIVAAYAKHSGIAKVIATGSAGNIRDYDDICTAAGENAGADFNPSTHPVEYLEMFEASIEGILSM